MSRIGKKPIPIPKGVTVKVDATGVDVKGPKGQMRQALPPGVVMAVEEGQIQARRERPDLVVLDIGMPGGDGHTVAQRLKGDPVTMFLPIIFLTARTNEIDFERARQTGVEKYLTKPFQVDELLLAVDELIERSTQSAAV